MDGWRVIEERDNASPANRVLAQTVYSTEYIDAPVCRDRNTDVDSDSDCLDSGGSQRYFYHQDVNYRVLALTDEDGDVVERYEYDAYGFARVMLPGGVGRLGTWIPGGIRAMVARKRRRKSIPPANRRRFRHAWDEAEYLYEKVTYWLYDRRNRSAAQRYADRLKRLLRPLRGNREAFVGAMGWAIMSELEGNVEDAIAHRERMMKAIHRAVDNNPTDLVITTLRPCYSRVLYGRLAELYVETGRTKRAVSALRRSKAFCEKYGIQFQCQNMLDDLCGQIGTAV